MRERSIRSVPAAALALLIAALGLQIGWHHLRPSPQAQAAALRPAPPLGRLRIVSLGDPISFAKLLMLWLQAFDNQPGISIPFRNLDYGVVIGWLTRILELDGRGQYPLLAAARLYGQVPVPEKQRQMLEFVYRQFLLDPNWRWPWLAHAVYVARHQLQDMPLALKYADALAMHATGSGVPDWAKQMKIFVLEDMGEIDAAKVLIGGLLDSGRITDPHELWFLTERLKQLQERARTAR